MPRGNTVMRLHRAVCGQEKGGRDLLRPGNDVRLRPRSYQERISSLLLFLHHELLSNSLVHLLRVNAVLAFTCLLRGAHGFQ